ncbi:MAG: 5'/3'-nucleotidase SurE [Polyangiaceae bacterium]|nr:5'/3'-nucleotidase SurE [Polyangiaceae bacterium]
MERPLVLLSNDDGYRARGIERLRAALRRVADVVVCAPETEQSAASHSLSLARPVRLYDRGEGVFSVDGTPADAVYVALHAGTRVLPRRPDFVVSGLNCGPNLGDDVFYSGTVAAAREGALRGLPSIAASAAPSADLDRACAYTVALVQATLQTARGRVLLNVNFPPGSDWTVCVTRSGRRVYDEGVEFRRDPRGGEYLWLGRPATEHRPDSGSDTEAFDAGRVGVTPLALEPWSERDYELARATVARVVAGG